MFLLDFLLSIVFQVMHIYFFMTAEFQNEENHILHVLVGGGISGIILFYSFSDGVRFLRSNVDKILYLISCILQKPILLPVLFPSRFKSRIAIKHMNTHSVVLKYTQDIEGRKIEMTKKILPTTFLMAVQETNFLYSFTLSWFVALSTACTLLIESNFNDEKYGNLTLYMFTVSAVYSAYGFFISVLLYGRKTDYLIKQYEELEQK